MNDQEKIRLSVVIPCYNGEATIGEQLDALADQSWEYPWEVVVADNRSTDRSMEIVKSYMDRLPVRIVDASERQGQPYALNTGAEAARGESVAFCDADDVVAEGWLPAMGNALLEHEFVACRIDTQRLNPDWIYAARGSHSQQKGLQRIWYPPYLPHAGGGTLGIRRAIHHEVGGFDETLPYVHDTDYCFRIQLRGHSLCFVPEAVMYIRMRKDPGAHFRQAVNWAEYNVKVYKRYARLTGLRVEEPWKRYLAQWKSLAIRSIRSRGREQTVKLLWTLGWQIGLLKGSVKYCIAPVPR